MATEMGMIVNKKRCFVKSEQNATIIAKPKAATHGGTLWSCVSMGE